jgi:queuosine precursor transporter
MTTSPSDRDSRHQFRYFDLIMAAFVTVLLCANLIGPAKVCALALPFALPFVGATLVFGAGNIFFPISYIFGDVLTEVYGYARARKVIWAGFAAMIFATIMTLTILNLPSNPDEPFNRVLQPSLEIVFGNTWRIVVASITAFWVGDFVNAYILARMKVRMRGRHLWMRTISSTIFGQGIDSLIFYPIAFYGIWDNRTLLSVLVFNWCFKVGIEVIMTPGTYLAVGFLKRKEQIDYYDTDTDFSPFTLDER